jgi:hypothetical protein
MPEQGFPWFIMANILSVLLVLGATVTRAKPLTAALALPAAVCGIVPILLMPGFVAAAAKFREYGIDLDAAVGSGTYTMLAVSALAMAGAALVWWEPALPIRRWEKVAQLVVGAAFMVGAAACFWHAWSAFDSAASYANEANEIETQLQNNQWQRPRVAGEELVQAGRAAAGSHRTRGLLCGGGGVVVLVIGGCLIAGPWLGKRTGEQENRRTGEQ